MSKTYFTRLLSGLAADSLEYRCDTSYLIADDPRSLGIDDVENESNPISDLWDIADFPVAGDFVCLHPGALRCLDCPAFDFRLPKYAQSDRWTSASWTKRGPV